MDNIKLECALYNGTKLIDNVESNIDNIVDYKHIKDSN